MRRRFRTSLFWILGLSAIIAAPYLVRYRLIPFYKRERVAGYYKHSRTFLNSSRPYHEVDIPFKEQDAALYVTGVWEGRPTQSVLDTGSGLISWPAYWHLNGTRTGIFIKGDFAGGITAKEEFIILHSIRLGDFQIENMPTTAYGPPKTVAASKYSALITDRASPVEEDALLGGPAFSHLVLTIDYDARLIILRDHSYDLTRLTRRPEDCLLTMSFDDNDYMPVVKGQLAGIPANFGIDTGCAGIPINGSFVEKLPLSARRFTSETNAYILDRVTKVKCLTQVTGSIGGLPFTDMGAQTVDLPSSVDALLGMQFLKHYRVTIDYTRNLILFEPYPISNSTPHHAT